MMLMKNRLQMSNLIKNLITMKRSINRMITMHNSTKKPLSQSSLMLNKKLKTIIKRSKFMIIMNKQRMRFIINHMKKNIKKRKTKLILIRHLWNMINMKKNMKRSQMISKLLIILKIMVMKMTMLIRKSIRLQ